MRRGMRVLAQVCMSGDLMTSACTTLLGWIKWWAVQGLNL